jgi:hypothetical protein
VIQCETREYPRDLRPGYCPVRRSLATLTYQDLNIDGMGGPANTRATCAGAVARQLWRARIDST